MAANTGSVPTLDANKHLKTKHVDAPVAALVATPSSASALAVQALISAAITALQGGAGSALDTLGEIQAALGNNPNLSATLTAAIAGKASPADVTTAVNAAIAAQAAATAATYVTFGTTAPDHTKTTVWVDTSTVPQVVKGYDGTNWVAIGGGSGGAVSSVAGRTGAVTLTKSDVSLGNVDNTSDANKPISTAQAAVNAAKADLVGGLVPTSQIPALALNTSVTVASQTAMLALTTTQVQPGDLAIRTDGPGTFILTAADPTQLANWTRLNAPTDVVTTVNGQQGTVVLAASDVGAATPASVASAVGAVAATAARGYFRGVNSQGGDANIDDGTQVPGTVGVNYWYNSQAHYDYLASRGHTIVRIGFLWERVQPTLGGALDATGLANLQAVVQRAVNSGLRVVLDMKNYGRFWVNSTTRALLGNGITKAQFADVWTKLATAFASSPGDICFGLMNEPYGLPTLPSTFVSTGTIDSFDTTIEGWSAGNGSATPTLTVGNYSGMTGAGALTATQANTGTSTQIISVQSPSGSGFGTTSLPTGSVLQFEVYVPVSNGGTLWQVRPSIIDTSFNSVYGSFTAITPGTVTKVTMAVPDAQAGTNHHQLFVEFTGNGLSGSGTLVGQVGDIQIGTATANPTTVWKQFSQAAVTAIRATGDTHDLAIAGDQFDGAWGFPSIDGAPWITDPYTARDAIIYEAHVYLDHDRSGSYASGSYATENTADVNAGWQSLLVRVQSDCNTFVTWLNQYGKRGFIGEIGWPSTFDATLWNTAAQACYDIFNAAGLDVAYWVTGENLSGTGPGGIYLEDLYFRNNYVPQAQAAVVEATRNLSKLSSKISTARALETMAKARPTGQWDFSVAPTIAGAAIGGAAVPEYSIAAGNWWTPSVGSTGTGSLSVAGAAVLFPVMLPATQNIDELALEVTAAAATGGVLGAAIYPHGTDGLPNFAGLIVEFPAVAATATGIKTLPASAAVQVPKGLVWIGVVARTATCTVRVVSNGYPTAVPLPAGVAPTAGTNIQVFNVGASTAFPTSGALGQGTILVSPPKFWLRGA